VLGETAGHFVFVCKPDSHPAIEEFRTGIVLEQKIERHWRGKQWVTHTYQWLNGVPLRGDVKAITVNWVMIEIRDANGNLTYTNSFITDLAVNADNVVALTAAGRAKWEIENESFNGLKTKGYNLEHNFDHGQQNLSAALAILNLLAFACHTARDLGDRAWRAPRRELGPVRGSSRTCGQSRPASCFHPGTTSWGHWRSPSRRRKVS
jgi:hypothetical protein